MALVHQRQQQQQQEEKPLFGDSSAAASADPLQPPRTLAATFTSLVGSYGLVTLVFLLLVLLSLLLLLPRSSAPSFFLFSPSPSSNPPLTSWKDYTVEQAAAFVARDRTVIVCAVSKAFLHFLNNWLISVARHGRHHQVLVIAEDYATLFEINGRWPGHAVLVPPAFDDQAAFKFGSPGFLNFTSRRPRHLLQILELGYNVLYNDVDMVWLADPFTFLVGNHDVYFADDTTKVKPLNHSHDLPPPEKLAGSTVICSCFIFLRPTGGGKQVVRIWIEVLRSLQWSEESKMLANDQPPFNWALNKTAGQVDQYLLPQAAFPSGFLYFRNPGWAEKAKGMHAVVHNNYIGFNQKLQRFRDYGLWYVDEHSEESPLGKL